MKRICLIIPFMVIALALKGQQFTLVQSIELPDSIRYVSMEAADLDNDGLSDLILFSKTSDRNYLLFVKGDTTNDRVLSESFVSIPDFSAYVIDDYDTDNQLDILLTVSNNGSASVILLRNEGNFQFSVSAVNIPPFTFGLIGDLDNDGIREGLFSGTKDGEPVTRTLHQHSNGQWTAGQDSLRIHLSAAEITDFDGNGNPDFFLSGRDETNAAVTILLEEREGEYVVRSKFSADLHTMRCDTDLDGYPDVIAYGVNASNIPVYQVYSHANNYEAQPLTFEGKVLFAFWADLNSDGLPDENILQLNSLGDTLNVVRYNDGVIETLPHKHYQAQLFADMENDGDLDLIQISGKDDLTINWFQNSTPQKNNGPSTPVASAFSIHDRIFLYWEKSSDDHTASQSVTYDVHLEGNYMMIDGSFDLDLGSRLRTQHGNNGVNHFLLLKPEHPHDFSYAIQSVDNALHASKTICVGSGTNCGTVITEKIIVCTGERIELTSPPQALWFSFAKGFIGTSGGISYDVQKNDTVFYLLPGTGNACPVVTAFNIEIDDKIAKEETMTKYVCEGSDVHLSIQTSWPHVEWRDRTGVIGTTPEVAYKADQADVVAVVYRNEEGCQIRMNFSLVLSSPELTVPATAYRIMQGQSVQLSATGAQRYEWTPSQGLNRTDIPEPIASPLQDTRYTVTAFDSLGCTRTAEVMVIVETTGFIPTLFTPNGDGQNDQLKVYGISGVERFSLKIYNREGSVVYKTTNAGDALHIGWNGESNGISQPNGVYYWKVEGQYASGNKVLLNGKEEGSLVLLR